MKKMRSVVLLFVVLIISSFGQFGDPFDVKVKLEGDQVKIDDVLAVLTSRELAELRAGYLTARERRLLAQTAFDREEQLWKNYEMGRQWKYFF